jgi:hypothetical protein
MQVCGETGCCRPVWCGPETGQRDVVFGVRCEYGGGVKCLSSNMELNSAVPMGSNVEVAVGGESPVYCDWC